MILKETDYPEIATELNTLIKRKWNIDVGWTAKPFDEGFEIPVMDSSVKSFDLQKGNFDSELSSLSEFSI